MQRCLSASSAPGGSNGKRFFDDHFYLLTCLVFHIKDCIVRIVGTTAPFSVSTTENPSAKSCSEVMEGSPNGDDGDDDDVVLQNEVRTWL